MKLKTINPITYAQWLAQAERFTKGKDSLITRNLPENTTKSGIAEILIDIKKPLFNGFEAVITYRQNFTKTVEQPIFDAQGLPTGQTEMVEIDRILDVISYVERLDYATINATLQQVDPLIDPALVGLDRQKATVARAILLNVVQHTTFGLTEADWQIID